MIYTVGEKDVYRKMYKIDPYFMKRGKSVDYAGGAVWETYEKALNFLELTKMKHDFDIWGVLAHWERDTIELEGKTWRVLKRDCFLVPVGGRK